LYHKIKQKSTLINIGNIIVGATEDGRPQTGYCIKLSYICRNELCSSV